LLSMGILDVFFLHLDTVPANPQKPRDIRVGRAHIALLGIQGLRAFANDETRVYSTAMINAWPGIFEWSVYFAVNLAKTPDKQNLINTICPCWAVLFESGNEELRKIMTSTIGSVELATRLWDTEDENIPSGSDIAAGPAALAVFLKVADVAILDRVVNACDGTPERVARVAIARLYSAMTRDRISIQRVSTLIDIINLLSLHPTHPFRKEFLRAHIIDAITATLHSLTKARESPVWLSSMMSGFKCLDSYLESTDGVTWVRRTLDFGFLATFVKCSPRFEKFSPEDLSIVLNIVGNILPRYLVYRTVVDAVSGAMEKIEADPHLHTVSNGVAKNEWNKFCKLSRQRLILAIESDLPKRVVTCDNPKVGFYITYLSLNNDHIGSVKKSVQCTNSESVPAVYKRTTAMKSASELRGRQATIRRCARSKSRPVSVRLVYAPFILMVSFLVMQREQRTRLPSKTLLFSVTFPVKMPFVTVSHFAAWRLAIFLPHLLSILWFTLTTQLFPKHIP
jgi:hypothetical protein